MKFDTMLFDLDGTLVDSAPDLSFALNQTLSQNNRAKKEFSDIRKLVSKGGKELIKFGFNITEEDKNFEKYYQQLLDIYKQNLTTYSQLFIGKDTLNSLRKWGIVTNKSEELTYPLLKQFDLKPDVIVCGDTLSENKPSPTPVLFAMDKLKIDNCAFVGDDIVDMQAGNSAKNNKQITTIAVGWGYTKPQKNWNYDVLINTPVELKKWIL